MKILRQASAPRYRRPEGIASYLLASPRTCASQYLTTTLVDLEPGGRQQVHSHMPEQIYFLLQGRGVMTVGSEESPVETGDCIFVPAGQPHGLWNSGTERLRYFSAAAPAFTLEELERLWPLPPEREAP